MKLMKRGNTCRKLKKEKYQEADERRKRKRERK